MYMRKVESLLLFVCRVVAAQLSIDARNICSRESTIWCVVAHRQVRQIYPAEVQE